MGVETEKNSFIIKIVNSKDLTSECWYIQFWGLSYCRTCRYLATEDCGGYKIRKKILLGIFPVNGLPRDQDNV